MGYYTVANDNWENLLDEVFEEIENLKPKPCNYGFYKEKFAYKFLKPKEKRGYINTTWNFKSARPLKIVEVLPNEVIFILTSSKTGELFGCFQDYKYGFNYQVPKVDFSKCKAILSDCKWIRPQKSTVFRKPHKGFCLIWSLSKKVFEEFATVCGRCEKSVIYDEDLQSWIRDEIKRYKRFIERKRRGQRK